MTEVVRKITYLPDEQGGLCYDLERARKEGLYERIRMPEGTNVDSDHAWEIAHRREAGVNVPPATDQELERLGTYRYGYGPRCLGDGDDDGA